MNAITTAYRRFDNESDEELIYRITGEKEKIGSWQDVADILNELLGTEYTESKFRKQRQIFDKMLAANQSKFVDTDTQLKEITLQKRELEKAKVKLQTEKLEYNRWLRENARDELITEKIVDAINSITPLKVPAQIPVVHNPKSYALCISDSHYGVEFSIKGLFGEIINEYSPEIFEKRMWSLFCKVKNIIEKENITTLHIYDFGDSIDGLLRVSQLWKLRYGVVDSTIKYAEFISNWLNEFTRIVKVKYQMVIDANHSQLRLLGQPKNTFKNDNMSKIIATFIKIRMQQNPNFDFIENPTGMIFDKLAGYNLLGIHGEVKNMDDALKDFSRVYKVQLNYLIGGHVHHGKYEEVGQDVEVLNIPSIIGIDDYSLSLLKSSNAGAKLFCFEGNNSKSIEYSIKL